MPGMAKYRAFIAALTLALIVAASMDSVQGETEFPQTTVPPVVSSDGSDPAPSDESSPAAIPEDSSTAASVGSSAAAIPDDSSPAASDESSPAALPEDSSPAPSDGSSPAALPEDSSPAPSDGSTPAALPEDSSTAASNGEPGAGESPEVPSSDVAATTGDGVAGADESRPAADNPSLSLSSTNDENTGLKSSGGKKLRELLKFYVKANARLRDIVKRIFLAMQFRTETFTSDWDDHLNAKDTAEHKEKLPQNCVEAVSAYQHMDGPYLFYIKGAEMRSFYAYCIHRAKDVHTDAWMIIQRRSDGAENFNRFWIDYKYGFGDLYGDYWLGLERIYQLTRLQNYELWILLRNERGDERTAHYDRFMISNEDAGYRLLVEGYKGNAGDELTPLRSLRFSTSDADRDRDFRNCARKCHSGWWYAKCRTCNINSNFNSKINAVDWGGLNRMEFTVSYIHMAIRPKTGNEDKENNEKSHE